MTRHEVALQGNLLFSKRLLLIITLFSIDVGVLVEEEQPSFTKADYHNMLSSDLHNIARYSSALMDPVSSGGVAH
jgi:hypothetical protein